MGPILSLFIFVFDERNISDCLKFFCIGAVKYLPFSHIGISTPFTYNFFSCTINVSPGPATHRLTYLTYLSLGYLNIRTSPVVGILNSGNFI